MSVNPHWLPQNVVSALIWAMLALHSGSLCAQDVATFDQRVARATLLLQQTIAALGGQAFQDIHDSDCSGRIAEFGRDGKVVIYAPFKQKWLFPDKTLTDYSSQGKVFVRVFNGEKGWTFDDAGISDETDNAIQFVQQVTFGMYRMLRLYGIDGTNKFHYSGDGLIDDKKVEWLRSSDDGGRALGLAIAESTHLPLRWTVSYRDEYTGELTDDTTTYDHFTRIEGVQTPLIFSHTQGDRLISETFVTTCKYNSNLTPDLFTRAALEQMSATEKKKRAN